MKAHLDPTLCTSTVTKLLLPFTMSFAGRNFLAIRNAPWSASPASSLSSSSDTSTESCARQLEKLLSTSKAAKPANHLLSITLPIWSRPMSPSAAAGPRRSELFKVLQLDCLRY